MHSTLHRAIALLFLACPALAQGPGSNGITELVSADGLGLPALQSSYDPSISADGRHVAFRSSVAFDPLDTNGEPDIYVLDRQTGSLVLASVTNLGAVGNDQATRPHISADGRWVVFTSYATNLVGLDTNGPAGDVFRKDLLTGDLVRVSDAHLSPAAGNGDSGSASISDDGRFVAFSSASSDLVPNDTNSTTDIFVRDVQLGLTQRASEGVWGQSNGVSIEPRISGSGTHVVYRSYATNLVLFDNNGATDVFLVELGKNPQLVSRNTIGSPATGSSSSPFISGDGTMIAYQSNAEDIVDWDSNLARDVFVYDAVAQTNQLVSISTLGSQTPLGVDVKDLSRDGRVVAMSSPGDLAPFASAEEHVYVHDLELGATYAASRPTGTAQDLDEDIFGRAALSHDGSVLAFATDANLSPPNPGGWMQTYVRTMHLDPFEYCTSSTTSAGCQPRLSSSGFSSVSGESLFTLVGDDLPNRKNGLLFYGFSGASSNPWGGGTMCVAGAKRRTPLMNTGGNVAPADDCSGFFGFDMNAFAAGGLGGNPKPELSIVGQQVNLQFWGRDPGSASGTFLSTALEYVVGP